MSRRKEKLDKFKEKLEQKKSEKELSRRAQRTSRSANVSPVAGDQEGVISAAEAPMSMQERMDLEKSRQPTYGTDDFECVDFGDCGSPHKPASQPL